MDWSRVRRTSDQEAMMRINRSLTRPKILLLVAVWAFCCILYTRKSINFETNQDLVPPTNTVQPFWYKFNRTDIAVYLERKLEDALKLDKGMGCDIPYLDPFAKEVTEGDVKLPPLFCGPRDWVKCYHSKCRIISEIHRIVADVRCEFRDIIYINDFNYTLGPVTFVSKESVYELRDSDHVNVLCLGKNISSGETVIWSANTLGFRPIVPPPSPPGRKSTHDVVIFIFDSASKTGFIRLMPETWKVLNEVLGATVMHGFNVVGDGTPFALFPLLTGKTELELPDVRRVARRRRTLDEFPFIFHKVKKYGYRTSYFEDMPLDGTFQYRFLGFERQPTDHYLRAFREASKPLFKKKKWNYCLGDTPQYKMMMNITEQFLELEGKHFVVTFVADITHDSLNSIQWADKEMAAFLRRLTKRADDTMIIVMGDHGPRFSTVRAKNSIRGKLDERLPLLAIRLPLRLRALRRAQRALEANSRVLTTVHDLHATILDVLDMRQYWNTYKVSGADLRRGLTLLRTIPGNRSCSEAGVNTHWCTCLVWVHVPASDRLYNKSAEALIHYINWLIEDAGKQCVPRTLDSIRSVYRQRANSDLLSFAGSANYDSYLGRFNFNANMNTESFNIAIVANPVRASYEASMVYFVKEDVFVMFPDDISRSNEYNGESDCIVDSHPHLAPYCYCRH